MNIAKQIAEELKIKVWQVEAVMELIDEGCTIPFIARYRKEKHGSLNDEQLRNLDERLTYLRNLEERKETVLASIEEQGKLTEELKQQILAAQTQVLLEDLYRPYRPKRRTRATIAKEKGLEGLANQILLQLLGHSVEEENSIWMRKKKLRQWSRQFPERWIFWRRQLRTKPITELQFVRQQCRKAHWFLRQKMQKRKRFTKIIMTFLRCFPRCPDISPSQLTAVRKKKF